MADNFRELPDLIKFSAENEIDYTIVSHVVPYKKDILAKTLYLTMSKKSIEILKPLKNYGWGIIRESTTELFGRAYGVEMGSRSSELIKSFWSEAEKRGYWINLPLLLNSIDKLENLSYLEKIFRRSEKLPANTKLT